MTDLDRAIAAGREALADFDLCPSVSENDAAALAVIDKARDLLAALDAARGEAVATVQTITSLVGETRKCIIGPAEVIDSLPVGTAVYAAPPAAAVPGGYNEDEIVDACMMAEVPYSKCEAIIAYLGDNRRAMLAAAPAQQPAAAVRDETPSVSGDAIDAITIAKNEAYARGFADGQKDARISMGVVLATQAPRAAVPEGGLRDSVLNSAKFRASCYALVGIVEGIEGLGRNWAANGERLKDTREWVAFYNCVASMRNGTFNQASAEQAQQPAAAVPADDKPGPDWKYLWLHRAEVMGRWAARAVELGYEGVTDALESLAKAPPAAAVPAANVTPMRQPRTDLARLVESIKDAVYANGDGLSVTEAIGALELAKLELLKEQEQ